MTARADVIARIADRIQFVTGAAPGSLAHDKPLFGQAYIDSLDVMDIAMAVEDEFAISPFAFDPDCSIDSIAAAVIAATTPPSTT